MKLALISDIHGNSYALDQVLAQIDADGIDQIVCLGDVALIGFDPVGSITRVAERGIPTVRGNTDDMVLNRVPSKTDDEDLVEIRTLWSEWLFDQIGPAERAFLSSLPPFIEMDVEGVRLCAYHGSPKSYNDPIRPDTSSETLDEFFEGVDASIFAGGHTHNMLLRRWNDRTVINPGTVGLPFTRPHFGSATARAEYAVITVDRATVEIAFRHVAIDADAITRAVHASGVPHPERWLEGYLGGWPM
jgi:putative phosphoesterase